jgi:hypothetical protein
MCADWCAFIDSYGRPSQLHQVTSLHKDGIEVVEGLCG